MPLGVRDFVFSFLDLEFLMDLLFFFHLLLFFSGPEPIFRYELRRNKAEVSVVGASGEQGLSPTPVVGLLCSFQPWSELSLAIAGRADWGGFLDFGGWGHKGGVKLLRLRAASSQSRPYSDSGSPDRRTQKPRKDQHGDLTC